MILSSGQIKNKMANNRLAEPPQEIEPAQENLNFEEARKLPNSEVNLSTGMVRQPENRSNTEIILKIINHSAECG